MVFLGHPLPARTDHQAARTAKRHRDGILRWFDGKTANGRLIEGINSLVQAAEPSREELIALIQAQAVEIAALNLKARIAELERRLGLNSSNRGKPPSSDGLKKPARVRSLREKSERKPGGQKGHCGETLRQTAQPDDIEDHFPPACAECGAALTPDMAQEGHVARQVFDLPEPKPLIVTEHRAGARVMRSVELFLERRLKLKINKAKSAVAPPSQRKFLGFSFTGGALPKRRISPHAMARFKGRVREMTRRTRGASVEQIVKGLSRYLIGWRGYYGFCETLSVLRGLDRWIRRRLRSVVWKQWKHGRNALRN